MLFSLLFSFLLGGVVVVAVEVLVLYWYLTKLSSGKKDSKLRNVSVQRDLCIEQKPLVFPSEKQGHVWVLEAEKPSSIQHDLQRKTAKEQKNTKEIVEVFPVKKNAKIKQHVLILTGLDGSQSTIPLLECNVKAVSSSASFLRKWMKMYPLQIESKKEVIYNGSNVCYLYLESAWEKEAWCKALRLASCSTRETIDWYSQLSEEFLTYLSSLNSEYPLFLKPSLMSGETTEKNNKTDGNSSRVRGFLKMITKKASKFNNETKSVSTSNRGERKVGEKNPQDETFTKYPKKTSPLQDMLLPSSSASILPVTQSMPASYDGVSDEKYDSDEGTVCLNLLFSRFFFDIQRSMEIKNFMKDRIQRTFSSMRIPSYISGINCTDLDLGCRPPYMHSIRALPIDMKEGWAVEVDFEYSGGFLIEIETRLEVRDPEVQKGIVSTSMEPNSAGDATSDLLEGLEGYSSQLNNSSADGKVHGPVEDVKSDVSRQSRIGSWTSRWRSMLHNVADHVSQVPISLEIRVASLRGTVLLQVKPPPSDQLWFCFTSMPEIDLNLNSFIGDHKIASTHVAMLISNRFKAAIRESLVLPNCESIYMPWMLAEKDDWLPRSAAPFIWTHQESGELTRRDASKHQHVDSKKVTSDNPQDSKTISPNTVERVEDEIIKVVSESVQSSINEPASCYISPDLGVTGTSSFDLSTTVAVVRSLDEVQDDRVEASDNAKIPTTASVSEQTVKLNDEDVMSKKMGKKERMKDFGRKVSVKLDEKIRHIEEKGRQIVENVSSDIGRTSSFTDDETTNSNPAVEELRVPLLANAGVHPSINGSRAVSTLESQQSNGSPKLFEETKSKKSGRKERMWDLGRKMSEKIDEKRRHIEEKGRHIVEKMKEGSVSGSLNKSSSSLGGSSNNTSFKE